MCGENTESFVRSGGMDYESMMEIQSKIPYIIP
jgi:hypothetical protein